MVQRQLEEEQPVGMVQVQDEDEQLAATAGRAIVEFLKGLAVFFTKAKALEQESLQLADTAKMLSQPATAAEDEELQRFIKRTSAVKRNVEEHWKITATISQFHRRFTARRSKSTDACDSANKRGNELHFAYKRLEEQRAREEQRRLDQEAEDRARREREAELARMEAEAVKREEAAADLSAREQIFVEQFAIHGNGISAARSAGFPDPQKSSDRLLKLAKIRTAVTAKQEAAAIRKQATARAARPLEVGPVETVLPEVRRAPGAVERATHSADLLDEEALVRAILGGQHGIPTDLLRIDTTKLNQYARDLQERINRWPGVRYKRNEKVS
jgi:hypothetical protein